MSIVRSPPSSPSGPAKTQVFWTPEKTYPFAKLPNGQVTVQWTPTAKNKWLGKTVVYQIKNMDNFKRYVGQTVCLFKRMSSHISRSSSDTRDPLMRAIQEDTEKLVVGAIATDSPDQLETELIDAKRTITTGFNRRRGGGGGTAKTEPPLTPTSMKKHLARFVTQYESPSKFPLARMVDGKNESVPESTLQQQDVVYLIQRKTPKNIRVYVGSTGRKFVRRLREHLFYIKHPSRLQGRRNSMYHYLHRFAGQCSFSVIDNKVFPPGLSLSAREQLVIEFYQNRGYDLFNRNRGGGGGAPKK